MPKSLTTRSERIDLRADPEVKSLIERAAQLNHTSLSAYLMDSAIQKAKQDLKDSETLALQERDRDIFFSALVAPPAPNKALRDLMVSKDLFTKKRGAKV